MNEVLFSQKPGEYLKFSFILGELFPPKNHHHFPTHSLKSSFRPIVFKSTMLLENLF